MELNTVGYSQPVDTGFEFGGATTTSWINTMEFEIAELYDTATMMGILIENGYTASFRAVTKNRKTKYIVSVTQTGKIGQI